MYGFPFYMYIVVTLEDYERHQMKSSNSIVRTPELDDKPAQIRIDYVATWMAPIVCHSISCTFTWQHIDNIL